MENNICDDQMGMLLPEDILINQILVLLPVISLLRFKSVCKSWRALIQSSFFVHLHLNNNNNNNNFGTFIFQTSDNINFEEAKNEAFMLSSGSGSGGEKEEEEEEEEELKWENIGFPAPLRYKVTPPGHDIFIVGSCNGLICIHETIERGDVSLWNPATRQHRLLPKSSLTTLEWGIPGDLDQDFVAFGYDVKTKDYKVVQISRFRPYTSGDRWLSVNEYIFRVQVYSLTTNSWRLLEGINSLPASPIQAGGLNHGVYLNDGSYYLVGWYHYELFEIENNITDQLQPGEMILSFDFTKEIFTTMKLPYDSPLTTMITTCFGGEKLALFLVVQTDNGSDLDTYEIWVLNESWTKLHSTVPNSLGIPRAISNNGEFALIATRGTDFTNDDEYVFSTKRLLLFNLVTKQVGKNEFPTVDYVTRANVYKQSLVSILSGNDAVAADDDDKVLGGGTM